MGRDSLTPIPRNERVCYSHPCHSHIKKRVTLVKQPAYYHLWVALILLGAAVLRLWELGRASLWIDENFTAFFAHAPADKFFEFLLIDGVHVPFYFMVMRLFPADPDFLLRLPSALMGVVSVALLMGIVQQFYGNSRWALWAGALLAFNPFHIWYSRAARPYALFFLVVLLASYYFLRLVKGHRTPAYWVAFTLASMAAYMTHYFALALPLAQYIVLAFVLRGQATFFRWWLICQVIAGIPLLVWIGALSQQEVISFGIAWIPDLKITDPFVTLSNLLVGYDGADLLYFLPALLIGTALLIIGIIFAWRQRKTDLPAFYAFWVVVAALVPVTIISTFRPVYHDRYFIVMLPALILLVLAGGRQLARSEWMTVALVVLLVTGSTSVAIRLSNREEEREGWRAASQKIEHEFAAGDTLMVINGGVLIPFERYTDESFDPPTVEIEFEEPPLLQNGGRVWVLYRNPGESLHRQFAMPAFDPFDRENGDDSPLAHWVRAHEAALIDEREYPGVTVLLFGVDTPPKIGRFGG